MTRPATSPRRTILQVIDVDLPAGAVARGRAPRFGADVDVAVHVADLDLVSPEALVEQDALGELPPAEGLPDDPARIVSSRG
jgi:hypothetical protein